MKIISYISRIVIGLVFIFSGTVKAIDPLGTVYKFQDYFMAFNLDFLRFASLPLAVILCTAEFLSGVSVLFNIRQKTGIWIVAVLMVIFTPLTFVLALTNPVTDCGCFGDAIHLTNWQTFGKNIILSVPVIFLFLNRKSMVPRHGHVREWVTIAGMALLFLAFILYNLRYLPVIDFLPYKTGTSIPDKMIIPEGMPVDQYETTFIYEKEGQQKEFTLSNYPADDTTWKFVDQRSVLISKGYQPPIHNLVITSMTDEDLTQKILSSVKPVMLMITRRLEEADPEKLNHGFELGKVCLTQGIDFYILTTSARNEIERFGNGLPFCVVDETTLKTMIRSNPGYIMLKEGTILAKWSWANVPENEQLSEYLN
jgi:hypothetical protein